MRDVAAGAALLSRQMPQRQVRRVLVLPVLVLPARQVVDAPDVARAEAAARRLPVRRVHKVRLAPVRRVRRHRPQAVLALVHHRRDVPVAGEPVARAAAEVAVAVADVRQARTAAATRVTTRKFTSIRCGRTRSGR